ncbi:MAG: hypothetical protein A2542_03220 [Parcubacteria group bacterium RIFOXYD2_FULL_52_8]|nr:MAG: hypothetical protein A2542_03220 [Parcubacteria group bacterium RIFOXYD2_FULL_52_8]
MKLTIPRQIQEITTTIENAGFTAYLVGGCVRDLLLSREPKDWDITTNARPEEIQALFPRTFYENEFGTVGVVIPKINVPHVTQVNSSRETHDYVPHEPSWPAIASQRAENNSVTQETTGEETEVVEVTPYRIEGKYSDYRHPDEVKFSDKLEDDLKRRDFTINALAYSVSKGHIIDLYKGQDDILKRTLRAVGEPVDRFQEDALRMLRAVRLTAELGFSIELETQKAIVANAHLLQRIAVERIKDEFCKMLLCDAAAPAIQIAYQLGLLHQFLPELEEGINIEQRGEHLYDVWEHNLRSLQHAVNRGWPFHVRLAALLHDVGKPKTRLRDEARQMWTFHGHDVIGGRMTKNILGRMKFSREMIDTVTKLVRYHLFFSDVDKITLSAVRRLVRNVGPENVWDLMKVRACDRIGTGRPKEAPYRLRKYEAMIEEAVRAPVTVGMLAINGGKIMELAGERPGPKIGLTLHALLEEVLDNPSLNTADYLGQRAKELLLLPDEELRKLGEQGREKKEELDMAEVGEIRKRHHVQ